MHIYICTGSYALAIANASLPPVSCRTPRPPLGSQVFDPKQMILNPNSFFLMGLSFGMICYLFECSETWKKMEPVPRSRPR